MDRDDPFKYHWLNDQNDPIVHDVGGQIGAAVPGMIQRRKDWLATQPEDVQALYCEHTSYIGADGALKYKCPMCNESGEL